jgi:predicted polyphosphate/ATP-dependent NAD kinase
MKRVGLIINPIAGMGGKVGLKGTDGPGIVEQAIALGAKPEAAAKASRALRELIPLADSLELLTVPGEMGEDLARQNGFKVQMVGKAAQMPAFLPQGEATHKNDHSVFPGNTGPADTEAAVTAMAAEKIDLLLFAGGDGTARNIFNVLGEDHDLPVIGIPAGVKIHSAVYAVNPRSAGQLARQFLEEGSLPLRRAEVMDIDEDAFRAGRLTARLYGYLFVPCSGGLMQHLKIGGAATEDSLLEAIAEQIVEQMVPDTVYIIGPGSTTGPIMAKLGLANTLLGVDIVLNGELLAADAREEQILNLIEGRPAKIIVTVIGGQGYIFGRGNQQISAAVIKKVGVDNIIVVATRDKILSLEYGRLLIDSGDDELNQSLSGYMRIITGYKEELIYPVSS